MSPQSPDYRQHFLLFVDDETRTRRFFSKLFGKTFRVILAEDGVAGLEQFRKYQDEVGVVVTDQQMPNASGTDFLEKVAILKPGVVRILSSAYVNIDAAIDAVNRGGIYRYVIKPWDIAELEVTLKRAMELYLVRLEQEELMRQNSMSLDILAASDRVFSLAALAIFRDSGLRHVGEALKTIVRLSEESHEKSLPESVGSEGLSWRELYRRHLSFLGAVNSSLPENLTSPESLSFESRCTVKEILDPLVADISALEWNEARGTPPDWPGPISDIQSVVSPLLQALGQAVEAEGVVRLEECLSGLEVIFPVRAVRAILKPTMSSSAEEPSQLAFELIASCLRITHQGGLIDILPGQNQAEARLRIRFDVSRIERAPEDAFEELAADLVGNDLFWSRFIE